MAYIRQVKGKWKAEVFRGKVRATRTFATEEEAREWGAVHEKKLLRTRDRKRQLEELMSSPYSALLSAIPRRLLDAAAEIPFTHDEIVMDPIPACIMSGIYFLISDGKVIYVGQSKNVFHRLARHLRDGTKAFDAFNVLPCPEEDLDRMEDVYIDAILPWMNNSFGRARKTA